ncbi:hypothetical protein BGZ73_007560 [Actinomortierella ambigua]|nr:hypothetical protein BGZ73_007560 [Actinomortierella ambigua]
MVQGNEEMDDPRWDDVIRFLPGQSRLNRSSTSLASRAVTIYDDDESAPLLRGAIRPTRRQVAQWTNSFWKRQLALLVLPVCIVLAWCSVPLKYYPFDDETGGSSFTNTWARSLIGTIQATIAVRSAGVNATGVNATTPLPSPSDLESGNTDPTDGQLNFWVFLWFYYGVYNAIGLLLITKIFNIYSLNWWPKALGGLLSSILFWLTTQCMGVAIYYIPGVELERYQLTWVFLTFCTMLIPLFVAFLVIRSENRNVYRHSLTEFQKTFLSATSLRSRIPASYVRFLWFCVALALVLSTIVLGENYAELFTREFNHTRPTDPNDPDDPHKKWREIVQSLVYVYSWVATIYIMDSIVDYIVDTRVRCYPLSSVFKLYFFMVYFIFYRNLFVSLRSWTYFLWIQLASSVWVCVFHPICMTHTVYRMLVYLFGITRTYDEYKRQVGRGLFLRNLAENATMLGFLCWVYVLRNGPNARVYPQFQFRGEDDSETIRSYKQTMYASLVIWGSELVSNFINRSICKQFLGHHVTREALRDLKDYPELIVAFVLVMVHVMQDMLLALLKLEFK